MENAVFYAGEVACEKVLIIFIFLVKFFCEDHHFYFFLIGASPDSGIKSQCFEFLCRICWALSIYEPNNQIGVYILYTIYVSKT